MTLRSVNKGWHWLFKSTLYRMRNRACSGKLGMNIDTTSRTSFYLACILGLWAGPQTPFYLAGHKLLFNMGMGPIYHGVGLIIPVLSYNGSLTISPTSCAKLMPDIELFCRYIRASVIELEIAAVNKQQSTRL